MSVEFTEVKLTSTDGRAITIHNGGTKINRYVFFTKVDRTTTLCGNILHKFAIPYFDSRIAKHGMYCSTCKCNVIGEIAAGQRVSVQVNNLILWQNWKQNYNDSLSRYNCLLQGTRRLHFHQQNCFEIHHLLFYT
jgi:hypothetical protein